MPARKWIWPLLLTSLLVFILSLRQLSDPDLGFHLKYGKWIVTHLQIPFYDQSTYTVSGNPYVDLHWLFQVILYTVYSLTGYQGLSILVCLLSISLFLLLLLRQEIYRIPLSITSIVLFIAYLIIDPRIAPRPEMFTFLFLACTLLVLDRYYDRKSNKIYLLPGIMLFWCNMHALFVLGLIVIIIYFASILIRDKKPDLVLLAWLIISSLACFINPYGIKSFSLPLELLSRFDPGNIFNQHIQEFLPFFAQPQFVVRDYLFMILAGMTILLTLLTYRNRKPHEIILVFLFGFLAIGSIRNIPLFVLVAIPVVSLGVNELSARIRVLTNVTGSGIYILMILMPLAIIPRIITNAWYMNNNSFNKTGMGINASHQPVQAADFLIKNHLDGRILNSIGFGGWLSWSLPQPVFIDGRLEVIKENLYEEVTRSWKGELPDLIMKYHPSLIVYNYLKYYPWTLQLRDMSDWRLIYSDGFSAIFAHKTYAISIPGKILPGISADTLTTNSLNFNQWIHGFWRQPDYSGIDKFHQSMLGVQLEAGCQSRINAEKAVVLFNKANQKYNSGDGPGAKEAYDSAILLNPWYAKAYNNRGILRATYFKDYYGAISDFDKAIKLNPHYPEAYLGRGTAFLYLENINQACKDWSAARSFGNTQAARLIELHCNR
jgi:hypothetical protein